MHGSVKNGSGKSSVGASQQLGKAGFLAKRRAERGASRGSDSSIEWSNAGASAILELINSLVGQGCTVTFAGTRDGSALKFSIYDGGERIDEYCRATEDIETFTAMLRELYGEVGKPDTGNT